VAGATGLIAVRLRLCFRRLLALAAPLGRPATLIWMRSNEGLVWPLYGDRSFVSLSIITL